MLDMATWRRWLRRTGALRDRLLPPDVALADFRRYPGRRRRQRFCGGQAVSCRDEQQKGLPGFMAPANDFWAWASLLDEGKLAPRRVFHIQEKTP